MNIHIIICITYVIGVILTYFYLERASKEYDKKHPDEVALMTKQDRKYVESMLEFMCIFSWLGLFIFILGKVCHNNWED